MYVFDIIDYYKKGGINYMELRAKSLLKSIGVMLLTIIMAVFVVSGLSDKGRVYAECSVSASYDDVAKTIKASGSYTESKTSSFVFELQLKNEGEWTAVDEKTPYRPYGVKNADASFDIIASGTYRVKVSENDYNHDELSTSYSEEMVVDFGDGGEVDLPHGIDNPKVLELPCTTTTVVDKWLQTRTGKMYYKLVVKDKAYYSFKNSKATLHLYEKMNEVYEEEKASSTELTSIEQLLDVGEYLLVGYGVVEGAETNITVDCRDFVDIKNITSAQDKYEVLLNSKSLIKLTFTPATGFESRVEWTSANRDCMEITGYDYDLKETMADKSKAYIYAKKLGEYKSTITTGEGVSKTITVMVKPNPTQISEATAVTSSKKKASLNIKWKGDGNYYKIYDASTNKVVAETASDNVTLNVAPGKTFNYKVESCYKVGGNIICSSMGNAVSVITAPYKMPTIKSAKQSGKTKYTKPFTKTVQRWNSYWHFYENVRVKGGNISTANVKIKYKKVSGAKSYESTTGKGNATGFSSGKMVFSYSGKIKAKTEKLKIRGVWKNTVTTAYGPWSKVKKIKIKGNK